MLNITDRLDLKLDEVLKDKTTSTNSKKTTWANSTNLALSNL